MLGYLAHPTGDDSSGENAVVLADNMSNASEWVAFFSETTPWTIVAPWHTYAIALRGAAAESRRMVHSLEALERCDLLILTGGYICKQMALESDRARRCGIPILNLTTLGVGPPSTSDADAVIQIISKAHRIISGRPRRVWLPLLTPADIAGLQDARHSIYAHMPSSHECAVDIIDRIIAAAVDE